MLNRLTIWMRLMTIPVRPEAWLVGLLIAALCMMGSGDAHAQSDNELVVASPQSGALIRSGWVPVLVRVPIPMRFHTASLLLDGELLDAVPTVIRRRWWEGKGVDLIASFSTAEMSPGWHTLGVVLKRPRTGRFHDETDRGEEWTEVERRFRFVPRAGRLEVRVLDEDGHPREARVGVYDRKGVPVAIGNRQDANGDPSLRDIPRQGFYVGRQGAVEFLKPGKYMLLASGGIRDGIVQKHLEVVEQTKVTLTVPRLIKTPGEVTADLHVHTAMSSDAFVPDSERFNALVAAGVEVAVVTDHNRIRDPVPALELLQLSERIKTITGAEMRLGLFKESIGHVNVFPLQANRPVPTLGDVSPAEAFGILRRDHAANPVSGEPVPLLLQLNHPRGIQFFPDKRFRPDAHALFEELSFDPAKPIAEQVDQRARALDPISGHSMLDIDAIEVLNRFSVDAWLRVRSDWFALLNRGVRITGTGNADSHTAHHERVGFPVNLVTVQDTELTTFVEAILAGNVRVSSGPLVQLEVDTGSESFSPSHTLVASGTEVVAKIRLDAAPWVPVPEVRLVHNGEVIFRANVGDLGPEMNGEWEVPITLTDDTWLVAEAGWSLNSQLRPSGAYAMVAPGHVPIGFTNPVWLDVDGDGEWGTIGGLEGQAPRSLREGAHRLEPALGPAPSHSHQESR
jgi:hypothetical protein